MASHQASITVKVSKQASTARAGSMQESTSLVPCEVVGNHGEMQASVFGLEFGASSHGWRKHHVTPPKASPEHDATARHAAPARTRCERHCPIRPFPGQQH
jgi:hypothetical protein